MSAWYYSKNGQQYGPVNGESLLRLIKEGVVKQSDAVWTEGMDEWERVAEVSASTLLQTIPDVVGAVNEPVQIGDFPRFVADFSEVSIAESSRSVKDTSVPADQYSDNYSYEVNPSFFSYRGRIRRSGYFGQVVLVIVIYFVVEVLIAAASYDMYRRSDLEFMELLSIFAIIVTAILTSFPQVKRLHDLDLSGWYYWLGLIPLVNLIFGLYVMFGRGTIGPNKYGPDPRAT